MQVRLLGPVQVVVQGAEVSLRRGRQRLLVAALALEPGAVLGRRRLVDALWPEDPPDDPDNALQQVVSGVRRALSPDRHLLETSSGGYRLRIDEEDVDARCLVRDLSAARRAIDTSRFDVALGNACAALSRWRGAALDGHADGWLAAQASALDRLRVDAELLRADALLGLQRIDGLAERLRPFADGGTYDEEVWSRYLLALGRAGRVREALTRYEALRQALAEELGVDPSPALRDLHGRLLREDASVVAAPRPHSSSRGDHLPGSGLALHGRDDELARVVGLVTGSARLVTLTGPAGSGKSTLAAAVMRAVESEGGQAFPGGVVVVRLDGVDSADGLGPALAAAVGVREQGDQQLLDVLANGLAGCLLLLDNTEAVADPVARTVETLLARQSDLTVLTTGRLRLGLTGEVTVRVGPLPVPTPGEGVENPAVRLLLQRVAAVRGGDGSWTDEELAAAQVIAAAVDGLPLALELVSARFSAMSLPQVAAHLGERLGLLDGADPVFPSKRRGLRDALAWSVDVLDERLRRYFRASAVLSGAFHAADLAALTGDEPVDVLVGLTELVDRGLVEAEASPGVEPRFRLLQTIRVVARDELERSGACGATEARLLPWLARIASDGDEGIRGPDQEVWMRRLDLVSRQVLTLVTSDAVSEVETLTAAAAALGRYWDWRGRLREADTVTSAVLVIDPSGVASRSGAVLAWRAFVELEMGRLDRADEVSARAVQLARHHRDGDGEFIALAVQSVVARARGDADAGLAQLEKLCSRASAEGRAWESAWSVNARGFAALAVGRVDRAVIDATASEEAFRGLGDQRAAAWGAALRALVAAETGRWDEARRIADEALRAATRLEDGRNSLVLLDVLARAARHQGRPTLGSALDEEARRHGRQRGQDPAALPRVRVLAAGTA